MVVICTLRAYLDRVIDLPYRNLSAPMCRKKKKEKLVYCKFLQQTNDNNDHAKNKARNGYIRMKRNSGIVCITICTPPQLPRPQINAVLMKSARRSSRLLAPDPIKSPDTNVILFYIVWLVDYRLALWPSHEEGEREKVKRVDEWKPTKKKKKKVGD